MTRLVIQVAQNGQPRYQENFEGVVDLGRRDSNEWNIPLFTACELPWAPGPAPAGLTGTRHRLIIAEPESVQVLRHAIFIPLNKGKVRLHNGGSVPLAVEGLREPLPRATATDLTLPVQLRLGSSLEVRVAEGLSPVIQSIITSTLPPGQLVSGVMPAPRLAVPVNLGVDQKQVSEWLPVLLELLQAAVTSADFLDRAARALVELVGMETGQVMLFQGESWEHRACYPPPGAEGIPAPSKTVMATVRGGQPYWGAPLPPREQGSLSTLSAVVAAPLYDGQHQVIGALYGARRMAAASLNELKERGPRLVEVVAYAVSLGLTRIEQEEIQLNQRVLEHVFPPVLAARLLADRRLPEPDEAEVTVLFSDIRRFSRLSEVLSASETIEMCRSVLGALAECVEQTEGVVVDFIGDGMMALWGAPARQPDHAVRACGAALEMFRRLPNLNELWKSKLGREKWEKAFGPNGEIELGVGINTGTAQVGNVGTAKRVKYGALGNMVNLASRIEGVTKQMKCQALLSEDTLKALREQGGAAVAQLPTRKLAEVQVVNINEPVVLHELNVKGFSHWDTRRERYEAALAAFEKKDWALACHLLGSLRMDYKDDGPSLVLLSRAVQGSLTGAAEKHPVWVLGSK